MKVKIIKVWDNCTGEIKIGVATNVTNARNVAHAMIIEFIRELEKDGTVTDNITEVYESYSSLKAIKEAFRDEIYTEIVSTEVNSIHPKDWHD